MASGSDFQSSLWTNVEHHLVGAAEAVEGIEKEGARSPIYTLATEGTYFMPGSILDQRT